MEALEAHKHPLQQIGVGLRFIGRQLLGGAWAELPRPAAPADTTQLVLPNLTAMYKE